MDTPWTNFRWWIATRLLRLALKVAPDGSAACNLEDAIRDWSIQCRAAWRARYGKQ